MVERCHVLMQIKLGASLFIPNSQIGTFGAVTQFKSLVRNNTDVFDVSFAGPLAAASTSLLLFVLGLVWSSGADIPKVRPGLLLASICCLTVCQGASCYVTLTRHLLLTAELPCQPFVDTCLQCASASSSTTAC